MKLFLYIFKPRFGELCLAPDHLNMGAKRVDGHCSCSLHRRPTPRIVAAIYGSWAQL